MPGQAPRATPDDARAVVYKIVPAGLWRAAVAAGRFAGAGVDLADGYIHFSTAAQVRETAARHFAGVADLLLVAADTRDLAGALRWEPSRGGDPFPHLYGDLPMSAVRWSAPLPVDAGGRHVFPSSMGLDGGHDGTMDKWFRVGVLAAAVFNAAAAVATAQAPAAAASAAEREVRAVIADYNAAYGRNDLEAYFKAFAPDLTQWFPTGSVDKAAYQASWTKYIGAGNRLEKVEVRDLRVQVSPSADAAVAMYVLRVTTRTAKGAVTTEDNQETDVLFKRAGAWTIVHVNYAPVKRPAAPGQS